MRSRLTAVPWNGRDAVGVFITAWLVLPVAVVLIFSRFPFSADWTRAAVKGDITASFFMILINSVAAVILVGFFLNKYRASWRDLGFKKFNFWKSCLYFLIASLGLICLVALAFFIIKLAFPAFDPNQAQQNQFTGPQAKSAPRLGLLALVFMAPMVEEIIFRGFMFPAFAKKYGLIGGAVIVSILFGLAHMQANAIIYTLILSLILCIMYYRLGSIVPGIILHMLNNYLAYITLVQK